VTGKLADPAGESGFSWGAMTLPFLDQYPLQQRIDFSLPIDALPNRESVRTWLPVFVCPSDPEPRVFQAVTRSGDAISLANANYVGLFGTVELDECENPPGTPPVSPFGQCISNGVFYHNSAVNIALITDGTSQTLMVGERLVFKEPSGARFNGTWSGVLPEVEEAAGRVIAHAEHPPNQNLHPEDFGSNHAGGTHFVLADGHVVFIGDSIAEESFQALGTRAGGDVQSGGF
jgi:hypothetical protein